MYHSSESLYTSPLSDLAPSFSNDHSQSPSENEEQEQQYDAYAILSELNDWTWTGAGTVPASSHSYRPPSCHTVCEADLTPTSSPLDGQTQSIYQDSGQWHGATPRPSSHTHNVQDSVFPATPANETRRDSLSIDHLGANGYMSTSYASLDPERSMRTLSPHDTSSDRGHHHDDHFDTESDRWRHASPTSPTFNGFQSPFSYLPTSDPSDSDFNSPVYVSPISPQGEDPTGNDLSMALEDMRSGFEADTRRNSDLLLRSKRLNAALQEREARVEEVDASARLRGLREEWAEQTARNQALLERSLNT